MGADGFAAWWWGAVDGSGLFLNSENVRFPAAHFNGMGTSYELSRVPWSMAVEISKGIYISLSQSTCQFGWVAGALINTNVLDTVAV